ncbi:formate dehydrogenase accessory sulfurtransferase FdhD [Thalassotalea agariperforans]
MCILSGMIKPDLQPTIRQLPSSPTSKTVNKHHYRLNCLSTRLSSDEVVIEEPLQINLVSFEQAKNNYQQRELAVIMRTPGDDVALITGFLFSEAVITTAADILSIKIASDSETNNIVEVELAKHITIDWPSLSRSFTSQSSCGLCGKTSIKSLALKTQQSVNNEQHWLNMASIPQLVQQLTKQQSLFIDTGGVHGAGLINNEQWISIREDIGRHNAVDKIIGDIVMQQTAIARAILLLTGRVSFELMQKAVMAGIPVIIAVGAPSSLAIDVAKQFNITLIGFTKNQQFNVYHGNWRINSQIAPQSKHEHIL